MVFWLPRHYAETHVDSLHGFLPIKMLFMKEEAAIIPTEVVIIAGLILLNGILAGAEIAIVSIRQSRLTELAGKKMGWVKSAMALRDNPERFLATVQVGITVIGTTAGAFGGSTLAIHLIPLLQKVEKLRPFAEEIAVGLVVAFISYLSIVLGELVPKSLAMRNPESYGRIIASPLLWLSRISSPAVHLLASSSNFVLKAFGDRTSFTESRLSSEEIRHLMEDAAKVGSLHPEASSIASRAIDFGTLRVVDVMVPRHAVISLAAEATLQEILTQMEAMPFSRFPIHGHSQDEILGYLAVKDVVLKCRECHEKNFQAKDFLRTAVYVPENSQAISLLQKLQSEHQQIAIAVDERGSLSGIVTMEDLLEELVGEIFSEFREERIAEIQWDHDGTTLIPGSTPIRFVNRQLGLAMQESQFWTTLGGICLHKAGHVPVVGEIMDIGNNLQAEIMEILGTRIQMVRLSRKEQMDES